MLRHDMIYAAYATLLALCIFIALLLLIDIFRYRYYLPDDYATLIRYAIIIIISLLILILHATLMPLLPLLHIIFFFFHLLLHDIIIIGLFLCHYFGFHYLPLFIRSYHAAIAIIHA